MDIVIGGAVEPGLPDNDEQIGEVTKPCQLMWSASARYNWAMSTTCAVLLEVMLPGKFELESYCFVIKKS
jgi:hypothetical protein